MPKIFYIACCLLTVQFFSINTTAQNVDINILKAINPNPPTSSLWKGVSKSHVLVAGTASIGALAYGFISSDKVVVHKAYETLIAVAINTILTDGIKTVFNRARPSDKYPYDVFVLSPSNGHSFPSGHTSLAFATATSFALEYKKWYVVVPAYLWAGGVGYSRMYLGKHYPTDVLAGAVVGAASSLLSHWISKKLFHQTPGVESNEKGNEATFAALRF